MKKERKARSRTSVWTMLLLVTLIAVIGCQRSSTPPPTVESRALTNGIRVVAVHFPGSTNAAIFTFLPMGLASDGPRQSQWSHLVEHLVIRSTVPADSPMANAETLPDHMRLDFYGSAGNWQEGLKHTADWLRGVPFTQQNLDLEKPKVNAECDFTVRNFATHKFAMAAWAQGHRHDQSHSAIKGDVAKATMAEIQKYRDDRLVVMSSAVVCVVGGVEPGRLLPTASEKLGTIKSSAKAAAPVKTQLGNREMTWDLEARHLVLTWPIPAVDHHDYSALLIASQWLNMQFFSDQELKKLTGMVFAGADLATPEGYFFFISASLRPEASFAAVREQIDRHLRELVSGKANLSSVPVLGKQLAESLTRLPDLALMKEQLPPNLTPAMLEMNIGLQWGMNEYRFGSHKMAVAENLSVIDAKNVSQTAQTHLTSRNASETRLTPVNARVGN